MVFNQQHKDALSGNFSHNVSIVVLLKTHVGCGMAMYCTYNVLLSSSWFQILSVLLVAGSFPAWTSPTTPVPILRYVDNQNIDGSYTYGYEVNTTNNN